MNHYTKDNFRLTQSVGFAINKARNLLRLELDAALKELDISSQQMGILFSLANRCRRNAVRVVEAAGDRYRPDDAHARQAGRQGLAATLAQP